MQSVFQRAKQYATQAKAYTQGSTFAPDAVTLGLGALGAQTYNALTPGTDVNPLAIAATALLARKGMYMPAALIGGSQALPLAVNTVAGQNAIDPNLTLLASIAGLTVNAMMRRKGKNGNPEPRPQGSLGGRYTTVDVDPQEVK